MVSCFCGLRWPLFAFAIGAFSARSGDFFETANGKCVFVPIGRRGTTVTGVSGNVLSQSVLPHFASLPTSVPLGTVTNLHGVPVETWEDASKLVHQARQVKERNSGWLAGHGDLSIKKEDVCCRILHFLSQHRPIIEKVPHGNSVR